MSDAIDLCPFCGKTCGSGPRVHNRAAKCASGRQHFVRCSTCHTEGPRSNLSDAGAIAAWNRRPAPAQGELSDAEIWKIAPKHSTASDGIDPISFARAIEQRVRGQVSDAADAARYRFVRQHKALGGPMIKHLMIGNLPLDESIDAAIQAQAGDVPTGGKA